MNLFFQKKWSPYFAGVIIGFLQLPAFLYIGKTLGASTAYGISVDFLLRLAGLYDPINSPSVENYSRFLDMQNWWYLFLLIGVSIGAFLSSRLSKSNQEIQGWDYFGIKNKKILFAFSLLGGFFMLLGARIASGCASGHGLSGIAKLQISSFITIMALFIFAIISVNVILGVHALTRGKK